MRYSAKHLGFGTVVTLAAMILHGCSQTTTVTNPTTQVKHCENTFVVSGYGYETALYEHEEGGVNFWKLRTYKDDGNDAFFDCKRNLMVSIKEGGNAVPLAQEGIIMEDITDNTRSLFHTEEGFNSIVARYKNGFIYSTAKLKGRKVSEQCGFVDSHDLSPDGREYSYVSSYYFDLDQRKKADEYKLGMWMIGSITGDEIYLSPHYKYNLKTKCSGNLWPKQLIGGEDPDKFSPMIGVISRDAYYDTTSSIGNNHITVPAHGQIYKVKDRIAYPLVEFPDKDIIYMVIPDDKHLYAFTRSRKAYEYDLEQNKTTAVYTLDINLSTEYELGVIGYTRDNFILTFEHENDLASAIIVTDRNFSKFSRPQIIHDAGLRVSSEQTIATDHLMMGATD